MPIPLPPKHVAFIACVALALSCAAARAEAPSAPPAQPPGEAQPVYTRARFVAMHEDGGKPYVRLTLVPRAKLPFSTQTFRLADRALLAGIPDGSPVEFVARRIDGENTVIAIRAVAACKRFQKC